MNPDLNLPRLSAADIANVVFAIERHLDLGHADWHELDVHWWPLYRLEIYRLLFLASLPAPVAGQRPRRFKGLMRFERTRVRPDPTPKAWLVSDGVSYATVGQRQIERFCGPLHAWCRSQGLAAEIIDRACLDARAVQEPTRWWGARTQRAKIWATVKASLRADGRHARLCDRVAHAATEARVILPRLDGLRFSAMATSVLDLAADYHQAMVRNHVRTVFLVSYYDVAGYAFCVAAARIGIPCVDVQHGVAGRYNLAYVRWPEPPASGWRLLPSWFWTWTQQDAQVINDWSASGNAASHHRAVCGGHPFLEAWLAGNLALDNDLQTALDRLIESCEDRLRVLVTLQPNLVDADSLSPLLQTAASVPEVHWLLRLHPMGLEDKASITRMFRERSVSHFDVETSTTLPLPALLPRCHVHATHSSSTVIEARTLGIPSIVWSRYGAELAEDAVDAGVAFVALDSQTFSLRLNKLSTAGGPTAPSAQAQRAMAALSTILEASQ